MTKLESLSLEFLASIFQEAGFPPGTNQADIERNAVMYHLILTAIDETKKPEVTRQTFNEIFMSLLNTAVYSKTKTSGTIIVKPNLEEAPEYATLRTTVNGWLANKTDLAIPQPYDPHDPLPQWFSEAFAYLADSKIKDPYLKYLYFYERGYDQNAIPLQLHQS